MLCGGGGIRTLEGFHLAGFQDRCIQPLCHPSGYICCERSANIECFRFLHAVFTTYPI